jgi:hypothetical protein
MKWISMRNWCLRNLDCPAQELVLRKSTRSEKKEKMSFHPNHKNKLPAHIDDEAEWEQILGVIGRLVGGHGETLSHLFTIHLNSPVLP